MKRNRPDNTLQCSFCDKSQDVVGKLISAPSGDSPRSYICDECIVVCNSILEDDKPTPAAGLEEVHGPVEIGQFVDEYLLEAMRQRVSVFHPRLSRSPQDSGAVVLAIRKPGRRAIFDPPSEIEITEDDYLIAVGKAPDLIGLKVVKTK